MANNNNHTDQEPRLIVTIKRLSEHAIMPTESSTGIILRSPRAMTLPARTTDIVVPTDLAFNVPLKIAFVMGPIPGIAWHTRNRIKGRLVTRSKEPQVVSVHMLNETDIDIEIKAGEPIRQLIMYGTITTCELVEEIVPSKNSRSGQYLVNAGTKRARTKD